MSNGTHWFPYFLKRVEELHADYNPEWRLLRRPFRSPGYHTAIRKADYVHPTREALVYAVALLDMGDEAYRERAFHLIERIVSLQDTDPSSPTFGIWSWFYEEPLEQMSPPDWNWADFNGKQLLLAVIRYADLFPAELLAQTKQAICNSCDAIIKRNVGPEYTNIAIMGAFVTLLAGETLGIERYRQYGLDRLDRFYRYTLERGAFNEYNSPTYAIIAVEELSSIATETSEPRARVQVAELLDIAWRMIAVHYHPPTGQWSGPQSRAYDSLLTPERLTFLQVACGDRVSFLPEEKAVYGLTWYGNEIACPEKYFSYFTSEPDREWVQGLGSAGAGRERQASTYMNGRLSLGTFNSNIMWNQCRNLLGYIVNDNGAAYVHLRVLHDGYDYSSAVFSSVQRQSTVLCGITFATDAGGTHPNLDQVHGRIDASDLRIRFELGGCLDGAQVSTEDAGVSLHLGDHTLKVKTVYGEFDGCPVTEWESSREGDKLCLDLVLYRGEPRLLDFHRIESACIVIAFEADGERRAWQTEVHKQDAGVSGKLLLDEGGVLELDVPLKPDTLEKLLWHNAPKTGASN